MTGDVGRPGVQIRAIGSFFAGGRIATLSGQPVSHVQVARHGPKREVDLNGDYVTLDNAHISVLDRGFIFGDGVYEVIPAYGGHPFRLSHHLQRLHGSHNLFNLHTHREIIGRFLVRHCFFLVFLQ